MPTARSSTEPGLAGWVDAVADLRHLLRFRAATVRRPRAAGVALLVLLGVTLVAAVGPLLVDGSGRATFLDDHLGAMLAGFLALAVASSMASGGGRELIPREQAAIHPISHRTEHLGALALAPLNFAWLLQAWLLLGITARVTGPDGWVGGQVVVAAWIVCATAIAQVLGWVVETVRRTPHGVAVVRGLAVVLVTVGVGLQATDRLLPLLDASPTRVLADTVTARDGALPVVLVLVALTAAAVVVGALPAGVALRRTPREELTVESGSHPARPLPASDLAVLRRIDRASVWRAVPMRRGLVVLAVGPGLVALGGGMDWTQVLVLPALVISGGALLFGVNAWCLDGRGALWRESLPVGPETVFAARALTLAEWLGAAALVTVALAALRAGVPSATEVMALVATLVVVLLQVVAVSMSWSGRRPFPVQLASARATPAPPIVMVGYSARLAVSTTLTAMLFSSAAQAPAWWLVPALAVPFLVWSWVRLRRARRRWLDAPQRARVVVAVAA
ncbi:hypothetical protein ASG88_17090 [Nocardioides sp. Soil777]|uniref:hypothetical protein n=1 Tax=Nocardioides sp. Soil777 TaxID=1736409 RepID=UPI000703A70F|nr:hypothetical protein [Nocardioides sp. Soil777]KRE98758.1 hypothetical protein ASG88_17090 [Nocardioides sp. Soil777]